MVRPRRERSRARRAAAAGFTLIEMLIVVAIIAITAALAAPAIHGSIMERKNNQASLEMVRLSRRARAAAVAYGRAHLLRFDASGSSGDNVGRFRVYRGFSSGCNAVANNWGELISGASPCIAGNSCVDELDLDASQWSLGSSDIRASAASGAGLVELCFEPRGTVTHRTDTTGRFTSLNTVSGGYVFQFIRYSSGTAVGVTRQVVVPLGGDARVLR